jgi:hypothetical protein
VTDPVVTVQPPTAFVLEHAPLEYTAVDPPPPSPSDDVLQELIASAASPAGYSWHSNGEPFNETVQEPPALPVPPPTPPPPAPSPPPPHPITNAATPTKIPWFMRPDPSL